MKTVTAKETKICILVTIALLAFAKVKADTIVYPHNTVAVEFIIKADTSKSGKVYQNVYAIAEGITYKSNKTTQKRYLLQRRYGYIPSIAIIDKKKLIVL